MILTVGHTKGGVGKTTLATNIASARQLAGRKVWLVDADRQHSSQKASTIRASIEGVRGLPCDWYSDAATLMAQVRLRANEYDDVIIECGGGDTAALRTSMALCDVMIAPFEPRDVSVWAFDELVPLIQDVRAAGKEFTVYAVLNMADPGKMDEGNPKVRRNLEAVEYVQKNYPQVEYLTQVVERVSYADAAKLGLSVYETSPKDQQAIDELGALISLLFQD